MNFALFFHCTLHFFPCVFVHILSIKAHKKADKATTKGDIMDRNTYSKKFETTLLAEYNEKPGFFVDVEATDDAIEVELQRLVKKHLKERGWIENLDVKGLDDDERHRAENENDEAGWCAEGDAWDELIAVADWEELVKFSSVEDRLIEALESIPSFEANAIDADDAEELFEMICDVQSDPPEYVTAAREACNRIIDGRLYRVRIGWWPNETAKEYNIAESAENAALEMAREQAHQIARDYPDEPAPEVEIYGGPKNECGWGACPEGSDGAYWPWIDINMPDIYDEIKIAIAKVL